MVQYLFTGADLAASATQGNYFQGDRIGVAGYARTVQGITVVVLQNTPAIADWSWQLYAGAQLIASGQSIVGRTTGNEVANPDDFVPVGVVVPMNATLQLTVTDTDAAIHNARVYMLLDRI